MLHAFDPNNPLSAVASNKLLEYQRQSPPVAYTTAVLREQASKGVINAMVMEEQAFRNDDTPALQNYVYVPQGIRHDHPVYTFNYVSAEKQEAAKLFVEFCLSEESQKLASDKGFNLHDDYQSQPSGLTGAGYLAAQSLWRENKDGGRPVIAIFIADVSGSMRGVPIESLRRSLIDTSGLIGSDHYVGLISYSDDVRINLPIRQFDNTQRAYFTGAVGTLKEDNATATYDAVMVALSMLLEKLEEIPDGKPMIFLLSDGDQRGGYDISDVTPIISGLRIPIYTIGYNITSNSRAYEEMTLLAQINEAAYINADSDSVVNQFRNLFTVQM